MVAGMVLNYKQTSMEQEIASSEFPEDQKRHSISLIFFF